MDDRHKDGLKLEQHPPIKYNYLTWGPFCMGVKVNPTIVKRLLEEGKQELKSHNHELAGHLNYQYLYKHDTTKWFYKTTAGLWDYYAEQRCRYHGLNIDKKPKYGYSNLWVNFMKAGDFNPEHVHGGDISFVLFLDMPMEIVKEAESFEGTSPPPGSLVFSYGQKMREDWNTTSHAIMPKPGDMWIFPALQHHSVMPFKSDVTRISVSGNLASNIKYGN